MVCNFFYAPVLGFDKVFQPAEEAGSDKRGFIWEINYVTFAVFKYFKLEMVFTGGGVKNAVDVLYAPPVTIIITARAQKYGD